jgi:hypothetical protein
MRFSHFEVSRRPLLGEQHYGDPALPILFVVEILAEWLR